MEKFQGKYRIPSARWATWDYGKNAAYFITICTADREHFFGAVVNHTMRLTQLGHAAVDCWNEIPAHFPFVGLDAFVVMPNHVHGIIVIDKPTDAAGTQTVDAQNAENVENAVETQNFASLPLQPSHNRFGPQSQNLASIVRGYKIGVTKFARQHNLPFGWQARYHDHVIRNDAEYNRIRAYIQNNPQNWTEDGFFQSENR